MRIICPKTSHVSRRLQIFGKLAIDSLCVTLRVRRLSIQLPQSSAEFLLW